jgi:hypothetical protein
MTLKVPRDADPAWGLQHRVRAAIIPQVDGDSDHFRPNGPPRQCPTVGCYLSVWKVVPILTSKSTEIYFSMSGAK